ncbi:MAG: hypothetical protein V4692_08425 [Bdellovibrionota bacterium]
MKKLILAAMIVVASAQAQAYVFEKSNCSAIELFDAKSALAEAKARFEVGEVTMVTVKEAELLVDETLFCQASANDGNDDDACRSLRNKQSEIADIIKSEMSQGLESPFEFGEALVKLGSLYKFCK